MHYNQFIILIIYTAGASNCTNKPDSNSGSTNSSAVQETVHPASSKQLLADTVTLHISNGSLSPDYQFSKKWVLTDKEAVYRETVGEEPERMSRKKMDAKFWEQLRTFDANAPLDKTENQLEGADEAGLIFHSGGKRYRFPAEVFDSKVAAIERFTDPEP